MAFTFGASFNTHEQALFIQARRAQLLAGNIANADTPHYKAVDIDFKQALNAATSGTVSGNPLLTTHARHLLSKNNGTYMDPLYRIPRQSSLDGNTVEAEAETAAFNDNSIRYIASLRFLNGKINTLLSAIRGE